MADTILGGDITVSYLDENRQKRLEWTGTAAGTRTMNEIYSAMANLLDEPTTGDDATCMTAETPVEYTIGLIDANDADPWYIAYECVQHTTGGALKTSGWTHTDGSATGIIVVPVTSNNITTAEHGLAISGATTGNGTLLEVINQGTTDYLVIRPSTNAASDNFTTDLQVITSNALTAAQAGAASNTGEQIWANMYNVTSIDSVTHVYMYQGLVSDATRARIEDINDATQDWWSEGAFDRNIFIHDYQSATFATIDSGYITVFARKGNTLYDSFEVLTSTTSGGRNPVPLSASSDSNNTTGYESITTTAVTVDDFTVGDEIQGDTSGARGILTLVAGASPTYTLHYILIGDPQTTFQTAAEGITNNTATGTATKDGNVPAAEGPALATWFTSNTIPTAAHGNTTVDIDDDGTAEGYGITVNCQSNPLTEVYEWTKYINRNGDITISATDGIEGEQYVGCTVFLEYSGVVTGTLSEGSDVTQATTGATGVVVSHDTTLKQILLRDTRETFNTTDIVTDNDVGGTVTPDTTAEAFNAVKSAPHGSLAGGRMFFARGVVPSNWLGADENSFETIDSQGNTRTRPTAITLSVSNTVGAAETETDSDLVWMHRLTGLAGTIDKTEYSATGGEVIGDATLVVDAAIAADVPGKTTGGVLNIRDQSNNNQHYRLRYDSWVTSTFTLSNINIASAEAGTNTTTVVSTGAFTAALRGDLVLNKTQGNAISYVTDVPDANTVNISPAITGQTTADAIELNAVPVAINTLDDVYISLIDEYATSTSSSVSIVYVAQIYFRVKVANTRNATKIKRFVTDDTTSGTDRNVATIRNEDTIAA